MNTFNDRLLEFISSKCRNDSEFADLMEVGKENISRIRNNKIQDHKVSLLKKMTEVFQLNPYDIYQLLMGEVFTEHPAGSLKAENDQLLKKVERLEKELAEKKQQYDALWEEFKRQNRIIENLTQTPSPPRVISGREGKLGEHGAKLRVLHKDDTTNGGNHVPP